MQHLSLSVLSCMSDLRAGLQAVEHELGRVAGAVAAVVLHLGGGGAMRSEIWSG